MNEQRRDDYNEKTRIQERGKKIRRSIENFFTEKVLLFSINCLQNVVNIPQKINKLQIEKMN